MDANRSPPGKLRQYLQDFLNRYQQGPQGISGEEAAARYREIAPHLSSGPHAGGPEGLRSHGTRGMRGSSVGICLSKSDGRAMTSST